MGTGIASTEKKPAATFVPVQSPYIWKIFVQIAMKWKNADSPKGNTARMCPKMRVFLLQHKELWDLLWSLAKQWLPLPLSLQSHWHLQDCEAGATGFKPYSWWLFFLRWSSEVQLSVTQFILLSDYWWAQCCRRKGANPAVRCHTSHPSFQFRHIPVFDRTGWNPGTWCLVSFPAFLLVKQIFIFFTLFWHFWMPVFS